MSRVLRRHSKRGEFSRKPPPTSRAGCPHRYKTHPAHGMHGHNRYKTLPASRKTPISALLTRAGRKLSRSKRKLPEQGELFPANHHPLATQRTPTVQNSPGTRHVRPQPVQNSPRTAKNTHFGPFDASREKIVTVETQTTRAGRTFSRKPPLTSRAGCPHRHKTHPAHGMHGHNRYKTLPALPNAHAPTKSHAIPSAPKPTTTQNVGIPMIEFQSWKHSSGNCMRNCRASRKTAHKAGPVVIHRPRLVCISCISANASDYQARTERS